LYPIGSRNNIKIAWPRIGHHVGVTATGGDRKPAHPAGTINLPRVRADIVNASYTYGGDVALSCAKGLRHRVRNRGRLVLLHHDESEGREDAGQ